jgi:hypothetical protein
MEEDLLPCRFKQRALTGVWPHIRFHVIKEEESASVRRRTQGPRKAARLGCARSAL